MEISHAADQTVQWSQSVCRKVARDFIIKFGYGRVCYVQVRCLSGTFDEFIIFNRSLTPEEILTAGGRRHSASHRVT
jgi:hypothetical protein